MTRSAGRDEGTVHVSLVEDGASGGVPGAEGPAGPAALPPAARRARRLVVAAVLALLALVVAAGVVLDRREVSRRAELAQIPGVLPHLDRPPRELWRARVGQEVVAADGVGVFSDAAAEVVQGIDLVSGAQVWSRDLPADHACRPVAGDAAAPRVACSVVSEVLHDGAAGAERVSTVLVLEAASGAPTAELEVPGSVLATADHDGDLLVASVDGDGVVVLQRWDPGADRHVWSRTAHESFQDAALGLGWVFDVEGGLLWWGAPGTEPLALEDGRPVPDVASAAGGLPLPDGGAAVPVRGDHYAVVATHVRDADGTSRFEAAVEPWLPPVTDGSAAHVLTARRVTDGRLSSTGDVVGLDARTGAELWDAGLLAGVTPRVQVDGVLVAVGAGRVVALDVATGAVVWDGAAQWPPYAGTMSDGDVVLVPRRGGDDDVVLAAVELRTGAPRWEVGLPAGAVYVGGFGDVLLVMTDDGTVVVLG